MKKSTKNFLIAMGAVTATAGIAAAYAITINKLMEIALSRKTPKATERGKRLITGSDKLSKVAEMVMQAAAELEKVPMETVQIEAADGIRLVKVITPSEPSKTKYVSSSSKRSHFPVEVSIFSS